MHRLLVVLAMWGACGGDEPAGEGMITLAITSPTPGSQFERVTLDDIGALVATVPVEVAVTGMPARVAISLAGTEIGPVSAEGTATAILGAAGAATLVATAFDADEQPIATAEVAVEVVEPTVANCREWLDVVGQQYTVGPASRGIADPVTLMMPINGVAFRVGANMRQTMLADCALARSLFLAAPSWRKRGIVEVTDMGVYNYRCINNDGTPPNCTIGLSEHSFGNAIDLGSFKDMAGEVYSVNDDWVIDPDDKTCTAPTEPGKDTLLHEMICELKTNKIWNIVLTPNYNALHRNHFHVDLTAGSDFITRTLIDEGVHGHHDHALDH
ncbi:MAG: extensin family protein [Kofleriaceae bacterium]